MKSVMGNFSNSIVGSDAYKKAQANSNMQAVQVFESTWRHPAPKMTVSQKNAVAIKKLIGTSKIPLRTLNICESLSISRGQFSASKPYLSGYKTIGCYWFAPENIEAARKKNETKKRLITISRNKCYNKKRKA